MLRLGRALHAYGYAAHQLEEVLRQTSERLGLTAQFFATPTSIFASFGPQDDQRTHLMRVEPGDVNLGKLAQLDQVGRDVLDGRLTPAEGSGKIEAITQARPLYGPILTVIAFAASSAAASRILGGGAREIETATLIGLLTGLLAIIAPKLPALARVFEPAAALLASAVATAVAVRWGPISIYITTLAGLIILLPGLTFTLALTELTTQNLLSGTARLASAVVTFLGVALGVALGSQIVLRLLGAPAALNVAPIPLAHWTEWVALVVAPLAFVVLLKAQPRDAGWVLVVCLLGFAGGRLGSRLLDPHLGVFVGSLVVGITGSLYGRFVQRPPPVTQVPGILLLLPGSLGFRSLAAMLDQQVVNGVEAAFTMLLTAIALVAGLLTANVLVPAGRAAPDSGSGPHALAGNRSREYRAATESDL